MKKLLLSLGAAFLLAAGAQAQVSYGLKAGVNLPKMTMKEDVSGMSVGMTTKSTTNFFVSGYANIFAAPNFAIQPGLSLQGKGGKLEMSETDEDLDATVSFTSTINIMSLDIPVNAVYYIPAGSGSVFVGAGPYVGFNLSGKQKDKTTITVGGETETESEDTDLKFGSDENEHNFKRLDYGVNFQAGYKLANGFLINAGYGLGLANLSPDSDTKGHNRILSFGIGFEF